MKEIDFIKWMCDKAEGFGIVYPQNEPHIECWGWLSEIRKEAFNDEEWKRTIYPLLLQRAIEGVNSYQYSQGKYFIIAQFRHGLVVETEKYRKECYLKRLGVIISIDQAKESALKYIYEQEKTW